MVAIQTDDLGELDFHDSTVPVHYGLLTKNKMKNIESDNLGELNIQDSSSRVHYGLLATRKMENIQADCSELNVQDSIPVVRQETAISSEVVLLPENYTSLDLQLFKIFKAARTDYDVSEQ